MILIMATTECNLACDYCYVTKKKGVLSISKLNKFLDLIDEMGMTEGLKGYGTQILGGEPLLYPKLVLQIADTLEKRYPHLGLTPMVETNLTLWNRDIERIFMDKRFLVLVSIDGMQATHDKHRKFTTGAPSYKVVIGNLQKLVKLKKRIRVNYTFDPNTPATDFVDFVKHINSIGPNVFWEFDIRPVGMRGRTEKSSWVFHEYKKLLEYMITQKNSILMPVQRAVTRENKTGGCGLGSDGFIIYPTGDVWPCNTAEQNNTMKIGNVGQHGLQELKKEVFRLRIWNRVIKHRMKGLQCECKHNLRCSKMLCIVTMKHQGMKCTPEDRFYLDLSDILLAFINGLAEQDKQRLIGGGKDDVSCE